MDSSHAAGTLWDSWGLRLQRVRLAGCGSEQRKASFRPQQYCTEIPQGFLEMPGGGRLPPSRRAESCGQRREGYSEGALEPWGQVCSPAAAPHCPPALPLHQLSSQRSKLSKNWLTRTCIPLSTFETKDAMKINNEVTQVIHSGAGSSRKNHCTMFLVPPLICTSAGGSQISSLWALGSRRPMAQAGS